MNLSNMLRRKHQAAYWCQRHLSRNLKDVVSAVRTLLRTESEELVKASLKTGYPGMPVTTIIELANLVNQMQSN